MFVVCVFRLLLLWCLAGAETQPRNPHCSLYQFLRSLPLLQFSLVVFNLGNVGQGFGESTVTALSDLVALVFMGTFALFRCNNVLLCIQGKLHKQCVNDYV